MWRIWFLLCGVFLTACVTEGPRLPDPRPKDAARLNADLGFGYLSQDRPDIAGAKFERALQLDSKLAAAHYGLGLIHQREGATVQARAAMDQARRYLDASPSSLRYSLADWYCDNDSPEISQQLLARGLADAQADAVLRWGRCLQSQGDMAAAEAALLKGLQQRPQSAQLVLGLVAVTVYQQDWLRAQDLLGRYEALAPITAQSALLGQQIFAAVGDSDRAREYARRAEELSVSRNQPGRSGRSDGGGRGY